jgi:hypothetical protein
MTCLQDYIGIKGCTFATSLSGLYINDLPGVEFQNIDQIANAEQVDYAGVWAEVQKLGLRKFKLDVIAEFGDRYKLNEIAQTVNLGKGIDSSSTTAAAAQWRGFTIELNQSTDTVVNSNLQLLSVQTFNLYLPGALNTTAKVFDLDTGEELFTKAVTGAAGWNTIQVNTIFSARRIFCCYDATLIASSLLDLSTFDLQTFNGAGLDCGCTNDYLWYFWGRGCSARVQGALSAKTATVTSVTSGLNTYGMSGIFSVKCGYDNVVCWNKEHFATALLYCLGAQLMTERIYSSRLNRWTTIDLAKAQKLRKEYELSYKGGRVTEADGSTTVYQGELKKAIYGITLNVSDTCLECDAPFRFMESRL